MEIESLLTNYNSNVFNPKTLVGLFVDTGHYPVYSHHQDLFKGDMAEGIPVIFPEDMGKYPPISMVLYWGLQVLCDVGSRGVGYAAVYSHKGGRGSKDGSAASFAAGYEAGIEVFQSRIRELQKSGVAAPLEVRVAPWPGEAGLSLYHGDLGPKGRVSTSLNWLIKSGRLVVREGAGGVKLYELWHTHYLSAASYQEAAKLTAEETEALGIIAGDGGKSSGGITGGVTRDELVAALVNKGKSARNGAGSQWKRPAKKKA